MNFVVIIRIESHECNPFKLFEEMSEVNEKVVAYFYKWATQTKRGLDHDETKGAKPFSKFIRSKSWFFIFFYLTVKPILQMEFNYKNGEKCNIINTEVYFKICSSIFLF